MLSGPPGIGKTHLAIALPSPPPEWGAACTTARSSIGHIAGGGPGGRPARPPAACAQRSLAAGGRRDRLSARQPAPGPCCSSS